MATLRHSTSRRETRVRHTFLPAALAAAAEVRLDNPHIYETFVELKNQGKVRFLGVTSHNDPAAVLDKATALGHYDGVQMAYNVLNGGYLEQAIINAYAKDVGIIAMKTAHAVATHHKALQPLPQWRIDKVNRIVPGDMKPALKGYLWVLQNPRIAAENSNLWTRHSCAKTSLLRARRLSCSRHRTWASFCNERVTHILVFSP